MMEGHPKKRGKGRPGSSPGGKPTGVFPGRGPGIRRGPGSHVILAPDQKAKNVKNAFKKLGDYMGKYRILLLISVMIAVLSTAASIFGPKILGWATTELFNGIMARIRQIGDIDYDRIASILMLAAGLYIGSMVLTYLQGWIMSKITADVTYRLRRDISHKINKLPFKYFDRTPQGEVLSRITNDVDVINQSLSQSLSQIITSITMVLGIVIMMLTISWQLTLIALLVLPISGIFIKFIVKRSQKYFRGQQDRIGNVNSIVEEMFGNHLVVKAFNGEEKNIKQFNGANDRLYTVAWKAQFFSALMMPIMRFIGNLGYVGVAVYGGYLTFLGVIALGDIQAFIQYMRSFTQPLSNIANISNIIQQTAAASERIFEFLENEEESEDAENPIKPEGIKGQVDFDHVKFGYYPDKIVIKDFTASLKAGQKIAIVGPTGAGKTTMVKLLMRFYDVNDGAIRLDGNDIREFTRKDLREQFAMVLQDTWLYSDTIMENIRFGRLDATDEEVIEAAKAAHVDHFVHTLPGGYNMVINEESTNISEGQKQLLTIARAVLANPKILILDEATSSVDTLTEILIQRAMDKLMSGRTSFVIAHRLSTIRDADVILVMKDGDIVEVGTHDELLEKNGFYAEIYKSQFVLEEE